MLGHCSHASWLSSKTQPEPPSPTAPELLASAPKAPSGCGSLRTARCKEQDANPLGAGEAEHSLRHIAGRPHTPRNCRQHCAARVGTAAATDLLPEQSPTIPLPLPAPSASPGSAHSQQFSLSFSCCSPPRVMLHHHAGATPARAPSPPPRGLRD